MHACLLNMLHDAADHYLSAVADGINVDFDGIVQKAIQQHRRIIRYLHSFAHIALKIRFDMDDFHCTSTQHVTRTHHQRIADLTRLDDGFLVGARSSVGRLQQPQFVNQFLEAFAILSHIDHVRRGADDRHAIGFQRARQFQRCLSAKLHDHANRLFQVDNFQHIFQCQRLKIKAITDIVIGRNRFRIAVDHDGFIAIFT